MNENRQAIDTITGYFYQFNKTILEILSQTNCNNEIVIEGIEDIDIKSNAEITAVQCKYYSKQTYTHSLIKHPIILMITHYANNNYKKINYKIYANFKDGHTKFPDSFDLENFKKTFLTYKHKGIVHNVYEELNLSDNKIGEFLSLLNIDIYAQSFEELEQTISKLILKEVNCSNEILELYYYKAGSIIKELATKQSINDRKITQKQFLEKLKDIDFVLDNWFAQKIGSDKYFKLVRKKYFTFSNVSPYERFFIIECSNNVTIDTLKAIVQQLERKWTKITKRNPTPFCPYLIFSNIKEANLLELKKEIQKSNLKFIDGYDFKGADFSVESIIKEANHSNGIKIKLILLKEIDLTLKSTRKVKEIYQFYIGRCLYKNSEEVHIKIKINDTKDVLNII